MKRLLATQLHLFEPRPYETRTAEDGALDSSTRSTSSAPRR